MSHDVTALGVMASSYASGLSGTFLLHIYPQINMKLMEVRMGSKPAWENLEKRQMSGVASINGHFSYYFCQSKLPTKRSSFSISFWSFQPVSPFDKTCNFSFDFHCFHQLFLKSWRISHSTTTSIILSNFYFFFLSSTIKL